MRSLLSPVPRGLTTGETSASFAQIYDASVSKGDKRKQSTRWPSSSATAGRQLKPPYEYRRKRRYETDPSGIERAEAVHDSAIDLVSVAALWFEEVGDFRP